MIKLLPILALLSSIAAPAQNSSTNQEEILTRTLRIMITGERALPKFKKQGNKYIEIDPDSQDIPPTAFTIGKPKKTPPPSTPTDSINEFSAWPNELIAIPGYTGKPTLTLTLNRPLLNKKGTSKTLAIALKNHIHPLILLHKSSSSKGWNDPQATVIDTDPAKFPARTIIAANLSSSPIRLSLAAKSIVLSANQIKAIRIPTSGSYTFQYKVDTQIDKKIHIISNSSYRISPSSRLILIAQNARGNTKQNPVAIRFINDPIPEPTPSQP